MEVGVLGRLAGVGDGDRVHAQGLLDAGRHQRRVVEDPLPDVRVLGEVLEEVAELPSRRVQPGEDEHRAHVEQHGVGQRLAVDRRLQQVGDEVDGRIAGLAAPCRQHVDEVAADAVEGGDHARDPVLGPVEAEEEVLDPGHEPIGVLGRQPDDREEDLGREADRELRHEVALPARGDLGDHPPADVARRRLGPADRAGRELGVEQLAVLDVLGRVDLRRHEAVRRVGLPRRERLAGEQVDVLVQVLDGVVAGDDPVALGVVVEERRRLLAERVRLRPVAAGLLVVEHREALDRAPADVASHRARIDRVIQQRTSPRGPASRDARSTPCRSMRSTIHHDELVSIPRHEIRPMSGAGPPVHRQSMKSSICEPRSFR